jgi:hypothetical protein
MAVGLVPHTGWTWLVRITDGAIVARERVVALPVLEAELYHHARDHAGDRAALFATQHAIARDAAIAAVRPHVVGLTRAVVIGKHPALPALDAIVRSHAMIHTAEGELWRALFATACEAFGLEVTRIAAAPKLAAARWLADGRARLGAPWTAEIKAAALAARALTKR